jgi:hypothetical protein
MVSWHSILRLSDKNERALALGFLYTAGVRTEDTESEGHASGAAFVTTHWSVVLAAGQRATPQSAAALEQLCRTY